MRSDNVKKGDARSPQRALLHAAGLLKSDLGKPFIGLAVGNNDLAPGHGGIVELARFAEKGIHSAGGYAFHFGVPGISEDFVMGHGGARYSLPLREIIADLTEAMIEAHHLDGLVIIAGSAITTVGMLMGAVRTNVPTIVVTTGPMLPGEGHHRRLTLDSDLSAAIVQFRQGKISEAELASLELSVCPGAGEGQGIDNATTMACLVEALGLSFLSCGTALAITAKKKRIAYVSGMRIVQMVREELTPAKILTKAAFENAIRVGLTLCGSTASLLHLCAIAREVGLELPLALFDALSHDTPQLTDLKPNGLYFLEDLEVAGGIPAILHRLRPKLKDSPTVSDLTTLGIAEQGSVADEDVIRPLSRPYRREGGIAVLRGNLAPEGCVIRQTGLVFRKRRFRGQALVFDSEQEALERVASAQQVPAETILVIRNEGPVGGPGMREIDRILPVMLDQGLLENVAIVTDGRCPTLPQGFCVGHVSPEAAVGGALAFVQNGDIIEIDIPERKIHLDVSEEELQARKAQWTPSPRPVHRGTLARYRELVSPASRGAVFRR
ncbi:MAG: dihydroxy-acid dehydratase [Deltaproteobacteria bacterium]|nr:MAG: dihydroxy-acid dehydratase [Deltaproteobacteria bacterium]